MKDQKCDNEHDDSFKFCPSCGESSPQVAQQPSTPMQQPTPPSGPIPPLLPPDYQEPPPIHSSKSWRKYVAIIGVSIIVILCLFIVLGSILLRGNSAKAKTEANQFIRNGLKKNYEAQYKQISTDNHDFMWVFIACPREKDGASHTDLPSSEASLEEYYAGSNGLLSGMFGAEFIKQLMQDGKLSSSKVTRINNQTYYVELSYKGATNPLPLFIKKQNSTYSVDLAATLVMSEPYIAEGIKQTVESLIKNPTTKDCDKAKTILDKSKTMKSELELGLNPGPKRVLNASRIAEIEDAIGQTSGFEELSSEVAKARENLEQPRPPS